MMLTFLLEESGNLVNLEKLPLNGNCLTKLPANFAKLKNLEELSMSGVPWCDVSMFGLHFKTKEGKNEKRT